MAQSHVLQRDALFSGLFALSVGVDSLFFIGSQLVALSRHGKIGVWHSVNQNWQVRYCVLAFVVGFVHVTMRFAVCGVK